MALYPPNLDMTTSLLGFVCSPLSFLSARMRLLFCNSTVPYSIERSVRLGIGTLELGKAKENNRSFGSYESVGLGRDESGL